jgi:hypothetical protein
MVARPDDAAHVVSDTWPHGSWTDVFTTRVLSDPLLPGHVAGVEPTDLIATGDGLVYGTSVLIDAPLGFEYGSPLPGFLQTPPVTAPIRIPGGLVDVSGHAAEVQTADLVSAALQDDRGPLVAGFSTQLGGLPTASAAGPAAAGPGAALGRTEVSAIGPSRVAFEAAAIPTLDASTQLPTLTLTSAGGGLGRRGGSGASIGRRKFGGSLR